MKKINLFSRLWSSGGNSQSSDVGYDSRFTVGSPSGFNSKLMLKLVSVLAILLTVGVGNAWAVDYEYQMITAASQMTAGTYVVGALRSTTATNNFYFGKATVSSGDWVVSDSYVTVAESNGVRKFDATSLPSGAVEFTFTGNNTDGFTIANGSNYLYYTANSNRKLAFASTSSTYKWTVADKSSPLITGGVCLKKKTGGTASNYTISENATGTGAIRGYSTTTVYRGIYLFKKQEKSGGSTPSLSATPTSLDWGTVNKGAGLTTKTFTISGSNLTGNLSVATTGSYTVDCGASITVTSGSPTVTTITVTAPSTATAGTKNGTITISGGGASSVAISCSLTVNEIDQFIDEVQSTAGYTSASPHIEGGTYSTPSLTDKSVATSGTCEQQHYHFVGWITKTKYDAGTSIAVGDIQTPTSATGATYYAVWAKQAAGGSSNTITLTYSDFGYTTTTYSEKTCTKGGIGFTCNQGCRGTSPYSLQMNSSKGTGSLYNTTAITGLQSVTLKCNANNTSKTATVYQGASSNPTSTSAGTAACAASTNYTINITSGSYFTVKVGGATYFSEVVIAYSTVTYEDYIAKCCTQLGTINGSISLSNAGCSAGQLKATWKTNSEGLAGIASQTLHIYDADDDTEVTAKKITGLTAQTSNQTQTISGLTLCHAYYVKVENISNGGSYCGDGWAGDKSSNATTLGYTYGITKTNVTLKAGADEEASTCAGNFSAQYEAAAGYELPATLTVTGASAHTWSISNGVGTLSISTANVTGNVTTTIAGICVTPSFTDHPASKTDYLTTDVATALDYEASAAGASLTQQWQVSTDNSNWDNIGGATSATYTPNIATEGTKYYRVKVTNSACSSFEYSNAAQITSTAPSGYCISVYNSSNNGIQSGFSNGGSGNEYTLAFTVSGKDGSSNWPMFWIGENNSSQSYSNNDYLANMHFTHSNATLGLAEGATGTLHIWDNNKEAGSNLWVKFEPDGYGLRWGGADWSQAENTKAFTVDPGDANVWWTDLVTLDGTNNTTWNYYVGLKTASGYVYSGVDNEATDDRGVSRTRSVTTMKVSNGTAGSYKATYLNSEATGTRGKFRIWDNNITDYNFVCHFVPYYRVTYNGSGASGSTAASADVCCEGNQAARTVQAAANEFTVPTGKSFGGWASSPENAAAGVVAYAAGANIILTQSITLYAIWLDIDYTVTVNQSPAAGATTTGQGTAHYNDAVNLTTTVPAGYRFVNWTTSDGFSITNPTSATTASFTMPAKNVTVTANFQQTHTVDWYVGGSAPANKIGDDGQTTVVDHGGKISDFPATTPDGSACDKEFVGWTNTSSYVHGTSPLFNDVAGSPTINANASFYAVFAEVNSVSASLTKMTADDDLEVGDKIVIIAQDTRYGMYQASASSYVSYWTTTDMDGEPSLSEIEADDKKYLDVAAGSASNTWKLGDATNGYLYNASSTNLEFSTTNSSDLTLITWTDDSFTLQAGQYISCRTDITGANANKWRGAGASCDPENDNNCSGTEYYYLYKYVPGGTTYTGHTINCADCGTSVTPTYTAAPTGGTVSVTKSATPVSSGSTVKTCTAVDLTVTLTPATHYTLTGFTATGLTTGAATISPAVNTVVPTTSAQTFTVTVSAGATGTLNLTPTFTPETPLTITLSTNSKGTFTNPDPWPIYSGESFTFPDVTPNDPSCATFVGWIEGTTFVGDGTTHDAPVTIAAGSSSGAQSSNTTYTAVFYETETSESDAYVKVTAAPEPPATWANDHYLIVYEDAGNSYTNAVAFAGSRDNGDNGNIDATSNGIAVTIVGGNTIAATSSLAANEWRIAAVTGGYSIQSASGYYIGRAANSNGIDASNSTAYVNTIGYSDSRTNITSAGGKILKYNTAGDQLRFRYLTSAGDIQLYKLGTAVVETRTYTTNPSCTPKYRVTVASVTGGSPSADPKFNPESTTVTITANPSAGYSFTSWTITKTTGGDNVTSTLLTGDKPTTANTTFTMPAYDITIAATYAKKMVSTLEVKDGATVISTTTGPVSGTVNVSTDANKTLDVAITPSDAFDHSWTAEVTSGSAASITNVTAEGFRVNGLAQGDATITVTAPNDEANGGTPKVVTFTVHVTDIMPEEIILKREGSDTPIETLIMYYDASESKGQYVKVNVSYSPSNPTNKNFTFSSAATGKVGSHSHSNNKGYEVLVANGVTTDPVNCTFTSDADGSVTKVLAVTVLPILTDRFVDYVHGNATQTVSARLSVDRYTMITDINTPSLSDASDADPTSEDCETAHYHLIGWLPQATAEALMAAGTPITDATEGLVRAGAEVEATGQTWCAIWAEEAE